MGRVVLDASVVIAFFESGDEHHASAVTALTSRAADDKILPASAFAECLVRPLGVSADKAAQIERGLTELSIEIAPITAEIAQRAAAIRSRHQRLRLGDALVLATGDVLGVDEVLTADRAWSRMSPRVRIV